MKLILKSFRQIREHYPFVIQIDEFPAMQEVILVSQRVLLLLECSFCPPRARADQFSADFPISKSKNAAGENGVWISDLSTDLKVFLCTQKKTQTHCVQTMYVPNNFNKSFVIPTLRGECSTHRNCSRSFQTRVKRKIGSCRFVKFCDGYCSQYLEVLVDYRVSQTYRGKKRKNCCFLIGTTNDYLYLDVQLYLYSNEQTYCFLTLLIQSQFRVSVEETVKTCSIYHWFWENHSHCRSKNWVFLEKTLSFFAD